MTKEEILKKYTGTKFLSLNMATNNFEDLMSAMQEYATQEKQGWVKQSDKLPEFGTLIVGRRLILPNNNFRYFIDVYSADTDYFDQWYALPDVPQKPEV